ncbi:hypothetical protein [Limimaricola cinnabarinus]|uniref:TnsA endonuclease N-terminal domain-containing protein n=1 Tax=Limimaricola cinnabarinus TaxID=1125964 RepID=A0A2G1MIX8_9RHOB|nr:hypothetical protein [Limimaricola cinnabarinus]PHP28701.1 hypothetical protein CJ301_05750 [Limimaricola cinnabarinus]
MILEHDEWAYSPPKYKRQTVITLGPVEGVLPFAGVRSPLSTSSSSHRVTLTYCVPANDNKPRIGKCESAAELAVAQEALMDPRLYDLEFQPCRVSFLFDGTKHDHTYDLRLTMVCGERRLVFVRNRTSLQRPKEQAKLRALVAATPESEGHRVLVVDADSYSRPRRDNLHRMKIAFDQVEPEVDEIVLETAARLRTLWLLRDLIAAVDFEPCVAFQSILRLIGRRQLHTNLDHVISYYSRIWWPE